MGHSQLEKEASRDRVLGIAARRVREEGVDGPGVADTMKEAGLTHGGFYKHFSSREDLMTQAAVAALAAGEENMRRSARAHTADPRRGLIDSYLSARHRDDPGQGCALVTLGAEAGRDGAELADAYEQRVRSYVDLIAGMSTDDPAEARAEALLTLSALVGAVLLSRGVQDPGLSDELLDTVAGALRGLR